MSNVNDGIKLKVVRWEYTKQKLGKILLIMYYNFS